MGGKNVCTLCQKAVAKSAHALKCSWCELWNHVGCGDMTEEDYDFMKVRSKFGFCWLCDACRVGQGKVGDFEDLERNVAERVMSSVSHYLENFKTAGYRHWKKRLVLQ